MLQISYPNAAAEDWAPMRTNRPWRRAELEKLKRLYPNAAIPLNALAAHFPGRTKSSVAKKAHLLKLRRKPAPKRVLTEDVVRDLRRRYQPNVVTVPMLALDYGLNVATVKSVVNGYSWRWVR